MYTVREYKDLQERYDSAVNQLGIALQALEDIITADDTSTLDGAVAIADYALKSIYGYEQSNGG